MRQHIDAARFREIAGKGLMPRFVKLAGLSDTYA